MPFAVDATQDLVNKKERRPFVNVMVAILAGFDVIARKFAFWQGDSFVLLLIVSFHD